MDPFDFLSRDGGDVTKPSTIDDDFDALFGSVDESKDAEQEEEEEKEDLLKVSSPSHPTKIENVEETTPTSDVLPESNQLSATDDKDAAVEIPEDSSNLLVDFGNPMTSSPSSLDEKAVTLVNTSSLSSQQPENSASKEDSGFVEKKEKSLFSFEDDDPGLDDIFASTSDSNKTDDKPALGVGVPPDTGNDKDIFDDLCAPTPTQSTTQNTDDTTSLDDIFTSGPPEPTGISTDLFTQKPGTENKQNDPFDIFGQSPPTESTLTDHKDPFDDIFTSPRQDPKPASIVAEGETVQPDIWTHDDQPGKEMITHDGLVQDGISITEHQKVKESSTPGADLLADHSDAGSYVLMSMDDSFTNSETDEQQGGTTAQVPDILNFLDGAVCLDLPDLNKLESSSPQVTDQVDVIGHPIPSMDQGDSTDGKRRPSWSEEEEDNDLPGVKLSVTAPSMELDDWEILGSKVDGEVVDSAKCMTEEGAVDADISKKTTKLKEDLRKEPEFMDFSILTVSEDSQLNVDVSKHKRSLSKKGSLALRKKPSRRALRSSGSDREDAHFIDSTEPKPPVKSDDEDGDDKEGEGVFDSRPQDKSISAMGQGRSNPITGGVKIPGLLEGLLGGMKKPKLFTSPDSRKSNAPGDTKGPPKEDVDFRSVLKSSVSSSPPSKSLKDSQNQSIAQTYAKPSDMRKQPMAGSIKLPAFTKPSLSPIDKSKPPVKATPPPVAIKPKPSLPGSKPKLSPIVKSQQQTNGSSTSPAIDDKWKLPEPKTTSSPSSLFDKKPTTTTVITTTTTTSAATLTTSSSSSLSKSFSVTPSTTTTKPSSVSLSSIRTKPFAPPKPRPRASTDPTKPPVSDTKLPLNNLKSEANVNKQEENSNKSEKTDLLESPVLPSSNENGLDFTDNVVSKPRKSSVSGVSSVQSPFAPDKSSPRKSSISGSAYAPMGFKSALDRSISNEGTDGTTPESRMRTTSIGESVEKEEDAGDAKKSDNEPKKEKPSEVLDDNPIDDKLKARPKEILHKDNRLKGSNSECIDKPDRNKESQKPMWGVQLRKVDKKPSTPSKPMFDDTKKELESPANWRQQLANKRKSITPKDPPVKDSDTSVPEWAKASAERRRRLMESGMIKSEAK